MKKIGILTYHSSINYGAYLQAYSLASAIKSQCEEEIEIIDYTPSRVKLFYILKVIFSCCKGYFFKNILQYVRFARAKKDLPLSKRVRIYRYEKLCEFINREYDVVVIGSDEVLSVGRNIMRPFPNIYWPNNSVKIPKLTYAGSANRSNYCNLESSQQQFVSSVLKDYKYIGVRDQHTYDQILSLDNQFRPNMNGDPTFLVDFNSGFENIKKSLQYKLKALTDKPIMAIMTTNDRLGLKLKEHFGDEFFILAVYYPNKGADYYYADMTPFEWAIGFSLYNCCVTQLFHGTIFNIKNNLPFISIDNNPQYDGRSTKISDLLGKADLMENYFNLRSESYGDDKLIRQLEYNIKNPQTDKMEVMVEFQNSIFSSFQTELKKQIEDGKIYRS